MWRGISLANKCLLLFGAAVVLIIVAALSIPWLRINAIVEESQRELSRQLVQVWQRGLSEPGGDDTVTPGVENELAGAKVVLMTAAQVTESLAAKKDPFVAEAWGVFQKHADETELHSAEWIGLSRVYRYAKAAREPSGVLTGMVVLNRTSMNAGSQLLVNTAYLLSAGLIALGLAVLVFYLITTRLILSPVRSLKETAEMVREGNLDTRADLQTGDEFEELSDAFNQMLENLAATQDRLKATAGALDAEVNKLEERNLALVEANKLKGEFLANVSHELRTPLNSIIGFTELLVEVAQKEHEAGDDSTRLVKRLRYLENINTSGRSLLEMINGLLEMAKVEAGKMDLRVETMNVKDACEGLVAMMRPVAERGGVELITDLSADLPAILTDAKKFQQIIFNLLSNAVKFTSERALESGATRNNGEEQAAARTAEQQSSRTADQAGAERAADGEVLLPTPPAPSGTAAQHSGVTLRAERLVGRGSEGAAAEDRLRVSVLDTGPGIAPEDLQRIFEKFHQLEAGHTRRHAGTGLGLAICKELTAMLQGEIQVESEPGRGSMFSVILPLKIDTQRAEEMRSEMAFRGRLTGQKERA